MKETGEYVTFSLDNDKDLVISLNKNITKKSRKEFLDDTKDYHSDQRFMELIEDFLCNGWDWVNAEDIGALTEAPLLTNDIEIDDQGNVIKVGIIYKYEMYQVYDPVEEIFSEGKIILTKHEPEN